jgi:hypothetical protein
MNKNSNNRPTFPIVRVASTNENEDNDDDFDCLNDLQFMTSIDGEEDVQPNVTFNYSAAATSDNNNRQKAKVVEPFEIDEEYSFQPVIRVNEEEMEPSTTTSTDAAASSRSSTLPTIPAGIPNLFSNASRWFSSATADHPTSSSNATTTTTTTSSTRMFFHALSNNTRLGQMLQESSHPGVAIFHVLFKLLALLTYIFGGWLAGASNFVTITVICIILLACDFWVVKNVSGRYAPLHCCC